MKNKDNREEILNGSLIKALLVMAVPVMINSFLQTMYNLTDTFWLGRLGTSELAAINLVTPVQNMVLNFGLGITVAGSVLISQYFGAKKDDEARSMANQIFACAMIFSLVCAVALNFLAGNIVTWLGAKDDTYINAKTYLSFVILDMPFLYLVNIYVAIHQAEGDTVRPMLLNLLGICINMVLDPMLMVWLRLGVKGAALATVFAKAVPAVIAFIMLHNRKNIIYLDLKKLRFEKEKIKQIISVGLPSAIGGSTQQLGFLLMSKNVFVYGTQAMAAYGIGNKVNGLITLPVNGIAAATSILVGQNYGAKQIERSKQSYKLARGVSVIFLLMGGMILSRKVISTAIVSIFSDDPAVINMAADFLSVMAFWCFTNGCHDTTHGFYRGLGKTRINMVMDISRLWIFRFGTLFFCQQVLNMGVRSVWYSVVVSNGIAAVILLTIYYTGLWKRGLYIDDKQKL